MSRLPDTLHGSMNIAKRSSAFIPPWISRWSHLSLGIRRQLFLWGVLLAPVPNRAMPYTGSVSRLLLLVHVPVWCRNRPDTTAVRDSVPFGVGSLAPGMWV